MYDIIRLTIENFWFIFLIFTFLLALAEPIIDLYDRWRAKHGMH